KLVGQLLQRPLPQPGAIPVAAARVRRDQQLARPGVTRLPQLPPPTPDTGHRELRGVVADADVHPPRVAGQVIDAIQAGAALLVVGEIVRADAARLPPLLPLRPGVAVIACR